MHNKYRYREYRYKDPSAYRLYSYAKIVHRLLKAIKIKYDAKILDAGCGAGYLEKDLYSFGYKNIWGCDLSPSGIQVAKENSPDLANRFFIHDIYEPVLPEDIPQSYDLIISAEVIEHLYSPDEYINNIHRWLNKNGHLIIFTPYHGYLKNLLISFLNKSDCHFDSIENGGHIKFFSKKTLSFLLNTSGCRVVRFTGIGRLPLLWNVMLLAARKK